MTNPEESHHSPTQNNDPLHPAEDFGIRLQLFWAKNHTAILFGCGLILAAILGRGGYEWYVEQREAGIVQDYAQAGTPEKLKAFASAHPTHALAGVAWLRVADEAYTAGSYAEAQASYAKALPALTELPLVGRAQLGAALSKIMAGNTAEGTTALQQIVAAPAQLKAIRAEAAYLLASQAAAAGNATDVEKYSNQLMQIDGASPWAQRAMMLRASLPTVAAPVSAP